MIAPHHEDSRLGMTGAMGSWRRSSQSSGKLSAISTVEGHAVRARDLHTDTRPRGCFGRRLDVEVDIDEDELAWWRPEPYATSRVTPIPHARGRKGGRKRILASIPHNMARPHVRIEDALRKGSIKFGSEGPMTAPTSRAQVHLSCDSALVHSNVLPYLL